VAPVCGGGGDASQIDWTKLQNYKMGNDISEYTMD
jgi:hypothetical protein